MQQSTVHTVNTLVEDHLDLAVRIARRYSGRGVEREDLEQVARLALVKAAHHYDPDRGPFGPFAATTVRGEVKRYFRDLAWGVRPPRRIQELQARMSAEPSPDGRDEDPWTLAARLGAPVADVREAMAARGCFACDSIDAADDAGHTFGVEDDRFDRVDERESFRALCVGLSDDDRRLLAWRDVEELTQQQIADRLGISQMQVSRRLSRLLEGLRAAAVA